MRASTTFERRLMGMRLLLLVLALAAPASAQDLWLTKAHDARRTGQSRTNGPHRIDPDQSWTAEAPGAHTINIGATVTGDGVFFGSWGLLRRTAGNDPRTWDKSDGRLFGLALETGDPLWGGPLDLDLTPRCYDLPGRPRTATDILLCGLFNNYLTSFYNGTVEGQATADTSRGLLYVGRGDGKLYAVDPAAGQIQWRYVTFNPEYPEDPDGGGEVVTSPLLGPDGTVFFGTWGEGPYETNAFYAVNPDSTLQWRYPATTSLAHRFFASPALSPDAGTIYAPAFFDDGLETPAPLYAFRRDPPGQIPDEQRLKWSLDLKFEGLPVWSTTLAVGTDGTIYVGGLAQEGAANLPVVFAVEDRGDEGSVRWVHALRDGAQFVLGIALRETEEQTQRLYVATSNLGTPLFNAKEEGRLYAIGLDGQVLAAYDPSDDVPEAVGGINSPAIGADGVLYFGVRGRYGAQAVDGQYFAVRYDAAAMRFERLWNAAVDGYVEWNHPAIGPDGGIYVGSSSQNDGARGPTYDEGVIPDDTTPLFYAFKGSASAVAAHEAPKTAIGFHLAPPYPNPFSTTTTFDLVLAHPAVVHLDVIDVLGRTTRRLADTSLPAGRHRFRWDGTDEHWQPVTPGLYFLRMQVHAAKSSASITQVTGLIRQGH